MKWLYAYLPHFYAESCAEQFRSQQPTAIIDRQHNIIDCNDSAKAMGISVEMNLTSAFCLCPNLYTVDRHEDKLLQAQNHIAQLAEQFSSWVSIDGDQGMFLEIASMRRLFGSTRQLHRKLCAVFEEHAFTAQIAAAPYPATARLLAKTGICRSINKSQVDALLANIPVHFIGTDNATELKLLKMGISTIGNLRQLNRSDLAHRIDSKILESLARVYGDKTWLPKPYKCSETFYDLIDLEEEFETLLPLRFILAQRISLFIHFLRKRQLLCQELGITFIGKEGLQQHEKLFLACPDNLIATWHYMLNTNIQRWQLKTPAVKIELKAYNFIPQARSPFNLFSEPDKDEKQQSNLLFNRLSTRLGPSALYFLSCSSDPRPENNTVHTQQVTPSSNKPWQPKIFSHQPIFIYETPKLIQRPIKYILHGPTRLNTGWWDTPMQPRDYYVVAKHDNVLSWVFRIPDGRIFELGVFS